MQKHVAAMVGAMVLMAGSASPQPTADQSVSSQQRFDEIQADIARRADADHREREDQAAQERDADAARRKSRENSIVFLIGQGQCAEANREAQASGDISLMAQTRTLCPN